MTEIGNEDILKELQAISGLLAHSLVRGLDTQTEKIGVLAQAGLDNRRISGLLGTTEETVRVTRSRLKGREQKKEKGESRGGQQEADK